MKNFLKELAAAGQRHQEQHLLQQPYPLKEIELSTLSNALTDDVLQYVMDIKSLQTVRIIKCSSITVNGIKDLIRNVSTSSSSSTCIKNIEIRQCDSVLLLAYIYTLIKQYKEKNQRGCMMKYTKDRHA
ncbi:hypothetical protein BDA99DRAFT_155213 [Phascolomyces articulosus]|uniref:Uncharacterized protein n=1 Tax=Phascolomyces articulosus TaxID=60185 RepID=A0AAD5JUM9_9FUNG|nr:hypothetical protein BDA99DRAFT_155213 [Phascolomyces articulosus]